MRRRRMKGERYRHRKGEGYTSALIWLPEDIYNLLAGRAKTQGFFIQDYLSEILIQEAKDPRQDTKQEPQT